MVAKDSSKEWMHCHAKKMMLFGALLFVAGLVRSMGYDWSVVLMVVGALLFLKGLVKKMM